MRHLLAFLLAVAAIDAGPALAIGCVRASCSPVSGSSARYLPHGHWRWSQGLRAWRSFRHFTGDREDTNRLLEHSEIVNQQAFLDTTLSYGLSDRLGFQIGLPYQLATRSLPVRDGVGAGASTIAQDVQVANAPGDLAFGFRGWLLDPTEEDQAWNLELGASLKVPTGPTNVTAVRRAYLPATGGFTSTVQQVDQSIMPGDGGFGAIFHAAGWWAGPAGLSGYLDGSYLLNPMDASGIPTGRTRPSEAIMGITDQFLARTGVALAVPQVPGLGASLGLRLDGVPVRDLLGASEAFRRPGVILSLDPGLSYGWEDQVVTFNLPWAAYRNRLRSVADERDGTHGDAAFADFLVGVTYTRTFE